MLKYILCEIPQRIINWLPDDDVGTYIFYSGYWGDEMNAQYKLNSKSSEY